MTSIETRIHQTRDDIHQASVKFGREGEVSLLAVSKTKPAEMIRAAYACGQREFGENYVQEGVEKISELQDLAGIVWHFIGPLQSNKTRLVAENFHWMHSVDRLKIAQRLSEQRPEHMPALNICLQVNIDNQPTKSGLSPEDVPAVVASILELPKVKLRGLMAIPAPSDEPEQQRQPFRAMKELLARLQQQFPHAQLDTLSMGMSGDMMAAIQEGATIVRVGTALFGARSYNK